MRINVCINGTFRYPQYIRHYEDAGALNAFYFAHRPRSTGRTAGLKTAYTRNGWGKELLLQAAYRTAPSRCLPRLYTGLGDIWQRDVIRHWRPCDSVEAVVGATADRVIEHAKGQGARVLGHPVTAHPAAVHALVAEAYERIGLDPGQTVAPDYDRRLAEIAACDRLLVDSRFVARSLIAQGIAAERIATITPGLDLARFTPRCPDERQDGIFRVVCVGLVTPRKGQQVLLDAWRRLRLTHAELVLVGLPGRGASAVLRGFGGTFTHHRRIPNAALRDLLIRAALFVAPSIEDGFGQAPVEAMGCGLPVVVTENVGMADLVTDGVDGFVVPPFDAEAIAGRIEQLYRDRERAAAMGQAAAAAIHRRGSWRDYVGQVLTEHRGLLEQPPLLTASEAA